LKVERNHSNRAGLVFDDQALVERAQAGQVEALGRLIAKYQDRIYTLALRLAGNEDAALELSQTTFLKCMQGLSGFRGKSGFYTWLVRILINVAADYRRRGQRYHHVSIDGQVEQWLPASQGAGLLKNSPSKALESKELQEMIWQAVDRLEDPFRQVLLLREVEGFDYRQISQVLEISVGTVKSRLHRAREALRKMLLPYLRG